MLGTSDSTLVSELGAPHVPVIDSWAQLVIWSFDQSACVRYIERPNVRNGRDDIDCQGSPAAVLPGETASGLAPNIPGQPHAFPSSTRTHNQAVGSADGRSPGSRSNGTGSLRVRSRCLGPVGWYKRPVTMMQQGIDKWRREQPAKVDAYMQCLW